MRRNSQGSDLDLLGEISGDVFDKEEREKESQNNLLKLHELLLASDLNFTL